MSSSSMTEDQIKANLATLSATTKHDFIEVETSTGSVALRKLNVPEALVIARDFPALQHIVLGGAAAMPEGEAGNYVLKAILDSGPEAIATLIVYCANLKSKKKELVPAILDKSDADIKALFAGAVKITAPEGVMAFFAEAKEYAEIGGLKQAGEVQPLAA